MFAKRILVTAGALALAAGLAGGLARSAQASSFPVIPQANLSYTCDAPRPIFILFSDVKAGNCSVEFAGNSLLYYTSGVVGARGPGSYIRWYKWSRTAEWGTGEGYNIADQNLRVTVEACVVRSYPGRFQDRPQWRLDYNVRSTVVRQRHSPAVTADSRITFPSRFR